MRPYIPETDFDVIRNWITDPRTHALWCANRFDYPLTRERFDNRLQDIRAQYGDCPFVALGDDCRLEGFFCYSLHPDTNEGMLKFVMVDPAMRGRGIGTAMMRMAVDYAFRISKADAVHLRVFSENTPAVKCYENIGFTKIKTDPDAFSYQEESWGRCSMVIRNTCGNSVPAAGLLSGKMT